MTLNQFKLRVVLKKIFLLAMMKAFGVRGRQRRLTAAAASQTCGLWLQCLSRSRRPGPAAASATCLRTGLPSAAAPRVCGGNGGGQNT